MAQRDRTLRKQLKGKVSEVCVAQRDRTLKKQFKGKVSEACVAPADVHGLGGVALTEMGQGDTGQPYSVNDFVIV